MKRFFTVLAAALSLTMLVSGCSNEPAASSSATSGATADNTGQNTAGATVPVQEPSPPFRSLLLMRTAPIISMWAARCTRAGC